jgi:hypothetical protein
MSQGMRFYCRRFLFSASLLLIPVLFPITSWAQAQPEHLQDPRGLSLGAFTGTFLPLGIPGVLNQLPQWGLRLGHGFRRSQLEYNVMAANAHEVNYYLGYLSLRNPIKNDVVAAHWIIGGDFHYFKRAPTRILRTTFPFRGVSGWHLGFGARLPVSDQFHFRSDFRFGFSPGQQLLVGLGFEYFFGPNNP